MHPWLRNAFYSAILWGTGLLFLWSGFFMLTFERSWLGALVDWTTGAMLLSTDIERYVSRRNV